MENLWQKIASLSFLKADDGPAAGKAMPEGTDLQDATREHIEQLTGLPCGRPALYRTALTHRSFIHDNHLNIPNADSNQRLEFLGDAVLDLIISEHLYKQYPASDEGHLSSNRSKIVNRRSLAGFAQRLALGEHLIIGESADKEKIRMSESALADAFEAFVGAVYLDQGLAGAERFIMRHVVGSVDLDRIIGEEYNHKSRLIEFTQSRHLPPPFYAVVSEDGAEHEKTFTVEVSCLGIPLGRGTAPRKKDAEQLAAREAMALLENHDPFPSAPPKAP